LELIPGIGCSLFDVVALEVLCIPREPPYLGVQQVSKRDKANSHPMLLPGQVFRSCPALVGIYESSCDIFAVLELSVLEQRFLVEKKPRHNTRNEPLFGCGPCRVAWQYAKNRDTADMIGSQIGKSR